MVEQKQIQTSRWMRTASLTFIVLAKTVAVLLSEYMEILLLAAQKLIPRDYLMVVHCYWVHLITQAHYLVQTQISS